MPTDPTRLDLVGYHADRLQVKTEVDIELSESAQLFCAIGNSGDDEQRLQLFRTSYRRSRTEHHSIGYIVQSRPDAQNHYFALEYFISPGPPRLIPRPMPEDVPATMDVLEVLSSLGIEQSFSCDMSFDYIKERYRSSIPLPLTAEHSPSVPWTEISGIHFVSSRGRLPLYDVIVEHGDPDSDWVMHMVSFAYSGEFALDLPRRILRQGSEISARFGAVS